MSAAISPARQRVTVLIAMIVSTAWAGALWWGVPATMPPVALDPALLVFGAIGAATLFALVPGIEAIAHERLVTPAIDPLAGADSPRLEVNRRYVQNTLEQLLVFAAGLPLLARYADPRALVAATLVWIVGRWIFWIGYHVAPRFRAFGLVGMVQSILVLLWGVAHLAGEWLGGIGAMAVVGLFVLLELIVTAAALRRPR